MKRFVEGEDRTQGTLLPERLDDYAAEQNPVRVIDVFVDELDLASLGFAGMIPAKTGRPAYHPAALLKIYIYGYLNRIHSSRRLERQAQRKEIEANISRYLAELDTAHRQEPAAAQPRTARLEDKITAPKAQMATLKEIEAKLETTGREANFTDRSRLPVLPVLVLTAQPSSFLLPALRSVGGIWRGLVSRT